MKNIQANGHSGTTKAYIELGKKLAIDIPEMVKRGQASTCMLLSAALEEYFEDAIKGKLPRLSKTKAKKWFGAYGPISTLEVKIEFAYLLELISAEHKHDANILRGVRNKFAHTTARLSFEWAEIVEMCTKLSTFKKNEGAEAAYVLAAVKLIDHVKTHIKEPSLFDPVEHKD